MTWADLWHGLRGMCSAGPSIQAIEGQIREDFGVSHAFLVSSGTAALTIRWCR
jgi:dTDP-4-amino-4,6-dideoxygalactose transaminase